MEIKLNSLILENFKGISYFELNVDGKNASVYGTNASGKTTLADAYFWLLFGKDSNGAEIIAPTEHLLRKRAMIHEVWKGGNFIWIK